MAVQLVASPELVLEVLVRVSEARVQESLAETLQQRALLAGPVAAAFEQQGHIEDDQRHPAGPHMLQETVALITHQRVDDRFEPAQRGRIAEDVATEGLAIDDSVAVDGCWSRQVSLS